MIDIEAEDYRTGVTAMRILIAVQLKNATGTLKCLSS